MRVGKAQQKWETFNEVHFDPVVRRSLRRFDDGISLSPTYRAGEMRLLLFSDLHCDVRAARHLVAAATAVDMVVGAGDLANARKNLPVCLDILKEIRCPLVMVAGNNESTEELETACRESPQIHILHGSSVLIQGVSFFGIGGGIPITPFGAWSYDFSEEQAAQLLTDCQRGGVLISHSPPKGFCDVASSGQSLGSIAVREAMERCQPKLVVCGHIHASAGQSAQFGASRIINAGPSGMTIDLEG